MTQNIIQSIIQNIIQNIIPCEWYKAVGYKNAHTLERAVIAKLRQNRKTYKVN